MLISEFQSELFADYFQFNIQDEVVSGDLSKAWTEEAVERLLAINQGTIGIGTVRDMDVQIYLKIFDSEPELMIDSNAINHINECDLEMSSDNLVIAGSTDYFPEAKRIKIGKGLFRVRVYYSNLEKLSDDRLDGEDSYEIHLWPTDKRTGIKILKNKNASA
ncbi:hypothetical protein [Robertkochia solimangrovi]|uniref:hypothetical protein n=1 Tax=Robertkochia solimangrovi TaxID=2213046 RepID=UPI0011807C76|nr:hypothetical protein [Robertkochia solimangrovi]TRZ45126.1 hypothetical protein DMZ48_05080 [Robertkochia solimangrovi]